MNEHGQAPNTELCHNGIILVETVPETVSSANTKMKWLRHMTSSIAISAVALLVGCDASAAQRRIQNLGVRRKIPLRNVRQAENS